MAAPAKTNTYGNTATAILRHAVVVFLANHAVLVGLFLRVFLAWFLPWLLDDGRFLPGVAYTDIDFFVFTDAARYIQQGQSPYDRHTYRYTPFLAELLAHLPHREVGRYIFCVADALCGWIIVRFRQSARTATSSPQPTLSPEAQTWQNLQDGLWWCYNPLAINICTRGSSESLMVLLPVLWTMRLVSRSGNKDSKDLTQRRSPTILEAMASGISHGIAIHSKLYPIIYSLSFMAYLAMPIDTTRSASSSSGFPWAQPNRLFKLILLWASRLFAPVPLAFLVSSLATFAGLTYLAVYWYGDIALQEGLLYHFSRVDHRHNYSMYWYWIYLARARVTTNLTTMGRLLLIPQVLLLVFSSLGIAPYNLGLALFVQTYLFVTHNKVITAQYFTWYLCLLPLCSDSLRLTRRVKIALGALLASIGFWLGSAYCLEMQGMAVFKMVWIASVVYFFANVNLMGALLRSYKSQSEGSIAAGASATSHKMATKVD